MHIGPQTARTAILRAAGIQELRITLKKPHPLPPLNKKVTFAAFFRTIIYIFYYEKAHL